MQPHSLEPVGDGTGRLARPGNQPTGRSVLTSPEGALKSLSEFFKKPCHYFEPPHRCFHTMQTIGGKIYLYGGFFNNQLPKNLSLASLAPKMYIYDPNTEIWMTQEASGEMLPLGIGDSASAIMNDNLYVYGGCDLYGNVTDGLYRFDTKSLSWYKLSPCNSEHAPVKIRGCGLVAFGDRYLGVFGGTWMPMGRDGCNRHFYLYDLVRAEWSRPTTHHAPLACCHFSLTMVDSQTALMFGGYISHQGHTNATYILNLLTKEWTFVQGKVGDLWPQARSNHAACCLNFGEEYPQVFMSGGMTDDRVLNDAWLFNVKIKKWNIVNISLRPRNGHAMSAIMLCPGVVEVVAFGGCSLVWKGLHDAQAKLSWTSAYLFQNDVQSGCWALLSQANVNNLGEQKRLAIKERFHCIKIQAQYEQEQREREKKREEQEKKRREMIQERTHFMQQLECAQMREVEQSERNIKVTKSLQEEREKFQERRIRITGGFVRAKERLSNVGLQIETESEKFAQEEMNVSDAEARVEHERRRIVAMKETESYLVQERKNILDQMKKLGQRGNRLQENIDHLAEKLSVKQTEQEQIRQNFWERMIAVAQREAKKEIDKADKIATDAEIHMYKDEECVQLSEKEARSAEVKTIQMEKQAISIRKQVNDRFVFGKEQLQLATQNAMEAERRLEHAVRRANNAEGTLEDAQERVKQMEEIKAHAEELLHRAEEQQCNEMERARQAEERVAELQQMLDDYRRQRQDYDNALHTSEEGIIHSWILSEDELQITTECIGRGGWAQVYVAHLRVAAKLLHPQLVYEYHQQKFQHEMNIAASVSHPNLLRFLGGRTQGGMAIITELMPTSLRAEIEKGNRNRAEGLSEKNIISISKDVCRALNYLHRMTPQPIIHRDISSANVLLKPIASRGWLAKVSDYGSANIQSQVMSTGGGNPRYIAPEAHSTDRQTVKMDIYSFGVLLLEMYTSEFPDPDYRDESIAAVEQPQIVELITQCLNLDETRRPCAEQILVTLTQYKSLHLP